MGCPDESELIAFAAGALDEVHPELEAHLDRCPACRAAVVGAAATDPLPGRVAHEDTPLIVEESGRYEALSECGRGGQSRVLRVFDRRVGREIALKELVSDAGLARERFLREVRIVGELAHPAVVPIHEVGQRRSGAPYYTMPLVDGRTLGEVVGATPALRQRLRMLPQFVQVCQAVAAAHELGVVHRDIKPANIMLGRFGEALLLDWGLAKFTDSATHTGASAAEPDDPELTRQGQTVGTPAYMSPEQAAGDRGVVDERSDVWSLGAVLFHILTARAPFSGDSATEVLCAVSEGRRQSANLPAAEVPPELLAVVDLAMHRDPELRYQSATELADDLIAFSSGGRVSAYDYSASERAIRFARRHRILLGAMAAVFAVLAVALIVVARSYQREAQQRTRAEDSAARAERARVVAQDASDHSRRQSSAAMYNLARAHIERAEHLRREAKVLRARLFAAASLAENPTHATSRVYDASLRYEDAPQLVARAAAVFARAKTDAIHGRLEVSPALTQAEPREVASASTPTGLLLAAADGSEVVEVRRGENDASPVVLDGHAGGAIDVAMSRNGRRIVTRDTKDAVRLWSAAGQLIDTWHRPAPWLTTFAVSNTGAVASTDEAGGVVVRDATSGIQRRVGEGPASALEFALDGRQIAVGDHQGNAWIYDLEEGRELARWSLQETIITGVTFGPRDAVLAIANARGLVTIVEPSEVRTKTNLSGHRGGVSALRFAPDAMRLFTAAIDGQVRGFDVGTGELLFEVEGPGGHIYELAVDDELVAVAAEAVVRWELGRGGRLLAKPTDVHNMFALRRNASIVLPHTQHAAFTELDTATGGVLTTTLPDAAVPRFVVPVADQTLVVAHADGTVGWWERREAGALLQRSHRPVDHWPSSFAAAPDGSRVAIDGADGAIVLMTRNGEVRRVTGHARTALSLAFSPDGTRLASAGYEGAFKVWDGSTGEAVVTLSSERGPAESVAFAGPQRIVGAGKGGVTVWYGSGWSQQRQLTATPCRELAVDDPGQLVAAVGDDGRVAVWILDGDGGELDSRLLLELRGPAPQGLVFGPHSEELWLVRARTVDRLELDTSFLGDSPEHALRQAERATGMTLPRVRG